MEKWVTVTEINGGPVGGATVSEKTQTVRFVIPILHWFYLDSAVSQY